MAKAKPQRKAPTSGSASKAATPQKSGVTPFDTTRAVESAAALVGKRGIPAEAAGTRKESAAFKQLKEGLNLPADLAIGKLLDKTGNPSAKKSSLPYEQNRGQVGHNQTFGADANRAGVPRRTGG